MNQRTSEETERMMNASDVWYEVITSKDSRHSPRLRITDHPFVRGLDRELLEAAAAGSKDTTYETGELVVRKGEVADRFHLIFDGKVAVEVSAPNGTRRKIQTIGPGEVLGWSWISSPYKWPFDGRALEETRVMALDASVVRRALETRPSDGYRFLLKLLPVIGQRLENTRAQLLAVHGV